MRKYLAGAIGATLLVCTGYALASRNSSGTMSAINGPYIAGTTITSSTINNRYADIEAEITDSLSRSGKGGMTAPLRTADGVVGTPSWSFTSEPASGFYRIGLNDLGLSVNGAKVGEWTASGEAVNGTQSVSGIATFTSATRAGNGLVGTPSYSFTNDTGTGLYRIGSSDLGVAVGGVKQLELTTSAATIVQPLTANGTANVVGNFSVATNKFNVTASNGNTTVGGSLGTGGDVTVNSGAGTLTASVVNTGTVGATNVNSTHGQIGDLTLTGAGISCSASTCGGLKTLSGGGGTVTTNGGHCVCTDTTANVSVKCSTSGTTLTITGTSTDVIAYFCF